MNRKMKILGILTSVALVAFVGTGLYLRFGLQTLDVPVMENPFPAVSESPEIRENSEMAELVEFSWHQSSMSYNDSFEFRITTTEKDSGIPHLYCDYTDPETGERIKIGEEFSGFQGFELDGTQADSEAYPSVPLERWAELADYLRRAELPAYQSPPPELLDATDSIITVTWRMGEQEIVKTHDGAAAKELLAMAKSITRETYSSVSEELCTKIVKGEKK